MCPKAEPKKLGLIYQFLIRNRLNKMSFFSRKNAFRGIALWLLILSGIFAQEIPTIDFAKSESLETGLKIEFYLSSSLPRKDVSGWIEQENWFILNFYNIIRPDSNFINSISNYPIQEIQQKWTNNSLQLSFQLSKKIGLLDVILHNDGKAVSVAITFKEFIQSKDVNPSFVFPNPNDAKKIQHPSSWKDARERTTLDIICDTEGLPIYVDNQMVGYSPLDHDVDVLPGWHKVGYFPEDYTQEYSARTSKEKMMNDILVMGRLDVFVEEGKHETIVLNYQSLEEDVIDYNKRFQTGAFAGFSLFFLMMLLMSWGLT
jgi:hypothetical protein